MKALHYYASIAEIRESVGTKKVSPVEIVEAHLERIETLQPKLNAFVHLDAEAALEQARRAVRKFYGNVGQIARKLLRQTLG